MENEIMHVRVELLKGHTVEVKPDKKYLLIIEKGSMPKADQKLIAQKLNELYGTFAILAIQDADKVKIVEYPWELGA